MAVKEEAVSGRLKKCLSWFLPRERIELGKEEDFLDSVVDAIVPLFELANASDGCSPGFFLRKAPIHAGPVLMKESRHWLERIHRRLAGRSSIPRPYYGEIQRDIPHGIFSLLLSFIRNTEGFARPFFSFSKTNRMEIVSLTCMRLVKEFFTVLSCLEDGEVMGYLKRTLIGLKTGHKVSLIANDKKEFSLKYNLRRGHLTLCFHYGEWNQCGYPQHN